MKVIYPVSVQAFSICRTRVKLALNFLSVILQCKKQLRLIDYI